MELAQIHRQVLNLRWIALSTQIVWRTQFTVVQTDMLLGMEASIATDSRIMFSTSLLRDKGGSRELSPVSKVILSEQQPAKAQETAMEL